MSVLDNFLLKLFEKYAELLKRRFGEDFQEVRVHGRADDIYLTIDRLFRPTITCQCLLATSMSTIRFSMLAGLRRTSHEKNSRVHAPSYCADVCLLWL